jgi:hypothetical protein
MKQLNIFVRNNESGQLKTDINDGTCEQNFSFFLFPSFIYFVLSCDSITDMGAKRKFEVMSS